MSLVREVPPGSGCPETALRGRDSEGPARVPEPTGTVDTSCRAGVSSPRVVSLHMVSVLLHGSPRGPAATNSGVRIVLRGPTEQRRVRGELPLPTRQTRDHLTLLGSIVFYPTTNYVRATTHRWELHVRTQPRRMRPRVSWMNQTDDRILELLAESGLILSPAVMAKNLEYSRNWISRRTGKLVENGLVEQVDDGYYRITDRGRAYLEGELEAEDLETEE